MKRLRASGFTVIEILSVVAVVAILTAVTIPVFQKMRAHANESAAQAALRTIGSAMFAYKLEKNDYPSSLSELSPSQDVPVNIEGLVATGSKLGYRFQVVSADQQSYLVTATPESPPSSGIHTFSLTETGTIQNDGEAVTGLPDMVSSDIDE
jgi:prepilin-type N-terminal cleavage/methylation domain-containing protein